MSDTKTSDAVATDAAAPVEPEFKVRPERTATAMEVLPSLSDLNADQSLIRALTLYVRMFDQRFTIDLERGNANPNAFMVWLSLRSDEVRDPSTGKPFTIYRKSVLCNWWDVMRNYELLKQLLAHRAGQIEMAEIFSKQVILTEQQEIALAQARASDATEAPSQPVVTSTDIAPAAAAAQSDPAPVVDQQVTV